MIRDKADGYKKNIFDTARRFLSNHIANIRLKPRVLRPAASARIGQRPSRLAEFLSDQLCRSFKFLNIPRIISHGKWNTVRRKKPRGVLGSLNLSNSLRN